MVRNLSKALLLGALGLLFLPLGLFAQTPTEGYDPMIQITHQFAHPIVYVLIDFSDAMKLNADALDPGSYVNGALPTVQWGSWAGVGNKCSGGSVPTGSYKAWSISLEVDVYRPAHLQIIKNVLGNGVYIVKDWSAPPTGVAWPTDATIQTSHPGFTVTGPVASDVIDTNAKVHRYYFTWTFTNTAAGNAACTLAPAAVPFTATHTDTASGYVLPSYGSPTKYDDPTDPDHSFLIHPLNLVASTANLVDWGFLTYSRGSGAGSCGGSTGDTGQNNCKNPADPTDPGTIPAGLQTSLDCASSSCTGWGPGGSDDLLPGLLYAGQVLRETYVGPSAGTLGGDCTHPLDPKKGCGRTYSTLLFAAGQSNVCNLVSGDGFWSANCSGACPGPNCCPGVGGNVKASGVACGISTWAEFPPYASDHNWNNPATGQQPLRTFVIGASTLVNPCELDAIAYMGRTDANSPTGDGGFKLGSNGQPLDQRLPQSAGDTTHYDSTKPYAYIATTSAAIKDAFLSVVAAVAAGDYATSAPVASSALTTGTTALLASAEYPGWKGHLYAYDVTNCDKTGCTLTASDCPGCPTCEKCTGTAANPIAAPALFKWDAGALLSYAWLDASGQPTATNTGTANPAYVSPANRKIYTWNSSNTLVEVTTGNAATINTICGSCGITTGVVDFIRGNNGALTTTARPWTLGSVVNSTPAVTQAVEPFLQSNVKDHTSFETAYANRTPLVWAGADDGMLHAFRLDTGAEVMAFLPPSLLPLQVQLKANYNSAKAPTGQPSYPQDHLYGVAGSPKYGDIWFSTDNKYKTVMLVCEGPGGNVLAALDVTDPVSTDSGYVAPSVIWSISSASTNWTGLYKTWSTPSAGASAFDTWTGIMGAGFNPASTKTAQVAPKVFMFNPSNGTVSSGLTLTNISSPAPWVGNQTFSDSVIFQTNKSAFYTDNLVNLALQPDLNGQIWFIPGTGFSAASVGINATTKAGQQQPIYYPPAVSGYQTYDIYAFGSGTVYERAFNNNSTVGLPSGTPAGFSPSLYIVTKDQTAGAATADQIQRIVINQELYVPEDLTATGCTHTTTTLGQTLCSGTHTLLGQRTQLSAPPALFVPIGGTGSPVAVFLLYDPDTSCAGTSYIVQLTFDVVAGKPHVKSASVASAGSGAASGFAVASGTVIVAKSGVGEGSKATLTRVPGLNPTQGLSTPTPIWWREVK